MRCDCENDLFRGHDTRSVNPGEAFGLTYWRIHVSLLASESVMSPLEDWRKAHTPPGKTGSMAEVRSKPELKSNSAQNVYKMSLCPKTSSHTQTCLNFRGVCLWEDSIWQANRKWESVSDVASSHCEIVIHVGQTLCSIKMHSLGTFDNFRLRARLFRTWISSQGFLLDCQFYFCGSNSISESAKVFAKT